MVKEGNSKLMITCTPQFKNNIEFLQDYYEMSKTEVIKLLVLEKVKNLKKGE